MMRLAVMPSAERAGTIDPLLPVSGLYAWRRDGEKQHDYRMAGADRDDTTDQRSPGGHESPQEWMRR